MTTRRPADWPPDTPPTPALTAYSWGMPEITETDCPGCGAQVSGLRGLYACGLCGWVNSWTEGSRPLPTAEDDPDYVPAPAP
ncbi:hypothetical protein [Streptomyces sp. NPDC050856]|uniref:hypothetical protein n=1 Tax=Streptomyces sp. NPDC050856 TaxID=3154939 RepID=UPI0034086853